MNEQLSYALGPDDLPMCPKHGIRLITDFFRGEVGAPDYEIGECKLCRRLYRFELSEDPGV